MFMVYEEEWKELARMFKVDCEIQVRRHFEGPEVLTSEPSVCQNCVKERVKQEVSQFYPLIGGLMFCILTYVMFVVKQRRW